MYVEDLTKNNMFPDFKILGGISGLKQEITSVEVCDAPDQGYWTRGGDFLISNGYLFKDNPAAFIPFLNLVKKRGVSAVGVKFDRFLFIKDIPEAVSESDRLGLPLLQIPWRYSWSEILSKMYSAIDKKIFLKGKDGFENSSIDYLLSLLENFKDIFSFTNFFSSYFDRPILIIRFPSSPIISIPERKVSFYTQEFLSKYINSPLRDTTFLPGNKNLSVRRESKDIEKTVSSIIFSPTQKPSFEIHFLLEENEKNITQNEENLVFKCYPLWRYLLLESIRFDSPLAINKSEITERLILGCHINEKHLKEFISMWGITSLFPCRVAIYRRGEKDQKNLKHPLNHKLFCLIGDLVVTILTCQSKCDDIKEIEKSFGETEKVIALSDIANNVEDIHKSFSSAKAILPHLENNKFSPGCYCYDDLLLDYALYWFANIEQGKLLWERYWSPIKNSKRQGNLPLEIFAKALINSNYNFKACSKSLNLHYNTVRNYYIYLEETLLLSLDNPINRTALHLSELIDKHFSGFTNEPLRG